MDNCSLKKNESEGQLLNELATTQLPMWIFDQETLQFLEVNEAAVARYGYTREEFRELDIRPPREIPNFLCTAVQHPHSSFTPERWHHLTNSGKMFEVEIESREIAFRSRREEVVCATFPPNER